MPQINFCSLIELAFYSFFFFSPFVSQSLSINYVSHAARFPLAFPMEEKGAGELGSEKNLLGFGENDGC